MKWICVLLLAASTLVWADPPKKYNVALGNVRIGVVDVKAGDYKLLIHQDEKKVELMHVNSGDMIDVTGTLETADAKYDSTEIHTRKDGDVPQITEIHIGGTAFKIKFGTT